MLLQNKKSIDIVKKMIDTIKSKKLMRKKKKEKYGEEEIIKL